MRMHIFHPARHARAAIFTTAAVAALASRRDLQELVEAAQPVVVPGARTFRPTTWLSRRRSVTFSRSFTTAMLVASGDGSIMTAGCGACIWSCTCWPAAALSCLCRFFLFASGRLISSSSAAPAMQLTSGASHQPAPPGRKTRHERPTVQEQSCRRGS